MQSHFLEFLGQQDLRQSVQRKIVFGRWLFQSCLKVCRHKELIIRRRCYSFRVSLYSSSVNRKPVFAQFVSSQLKVIKVFVCNSFQFSLLVRCHFLKCKWVQKEQDDKHCTASTWKRKKLYTGAFYIGDASVLPRFLKSWQLSLFGSGQKSLWSFKKRQDRNFSLFSDDDSSES